LWYGEVSSLRSCENEGLNVAPRFGDPGTPEAQLYGGVISCDCWRQKTETNVSIANIFGLVHSGELFRAHG
jgi:hypothetical protein